MSFKFIYKKDYKNKGWVLYFDKYVVYGKTREKCDEKLNKTLDTKREMRGVNYDSRI